MRRTHDRSELGARGEDAARREYSRRGYRVVARNWRCALGEIDLVAERGDLLVFCEVKTRSPSPMGAGWEAVTPSKRARIRRTAEAFLVSAPRYRRRPIRFDVASVARLDTGLDVVIFEDAF